VELPHEARHVRELDALALAVATRRARLDDASRRLEPHQRLRLAHLDHASLEQHRRRADRVRSRHGRILGRLHDDEAGVAVVPRRRHDEVRVARDASAWLSQKHAAQPVAVAPERLHLLEDRRAGRRQDAADDHVPDLAARVAADHGQRPSGPHLGATIRNCETADVTELVAFLGVSAIVIVTPGPDTALTIRSSLLCGRRAGIFTALGVSSGQAIWTLASAVGIAALLAASEPAFLAVKVVGAAYLIWLGLQALAAAVRGRRKGAEAPRLKTLEPRR